MKFKEVLVLNIYWLFIIQNISNNYVTILSCYILTLGQAS